MHPLTPDLSKLSLDELTNKFSDLQQRIGMAYKWGNPDMVQQLQMILGDYQNELTLRNQKQLDELQNKSKTFKNIIDIQ
jgi:hypothetical protein